jgi:hypothetical protein
VSGSLKAVAPPSLRGGLVGYNSAMKNFMLLRIAMLLCVLGLIAGLMCRPAEN